MRLLLLVRAYQVGGAGTAAADHEGRGMPWLVLQECVQSFLFGTDAAVLACPHSISVPITEHISADHGRNCKLRAGQRALHGEAGPAGAGPAANAGGAGPRPVWLLRQGPGPRVRFSAVEP